MSKRKNRCPLVMIEWEDSRRPVAEWVFLSGLAASSAVRCASVGWLVHDTRRVKALAPNMGDIGDAASMQASGIIQIPTRCVTRIVRLRETK